MEDVDVADDGFGYFSAMSYGNVVQVPGQVSFGTHTVFARATDYMTFMSGGTPGQWKEFHITVNPPPNVAPWIDSLKFDTQYFSGETANGNLVGKISDSKLYSAQVEFDLDRNGTVDPGVAQVNGIDFTRPASFSIGSHLINAGVREFDYVSNQNIVGDWQTFPIVVNAPISVDLEFPGISDADEDSQIAVFLLFGDRSNSRTSCADRHYDRRTR